MCAICVSLVLTLEVYKGVWAPPGILYILKKRDTQTVILREA